MAGTKLGFTTKITKHTKVRIKVGAKNISPLPEPFVTFVPSW